jgi:HEAT repeat protein
LFIIRFMRRSFLLIGLILSAYFWPEQILAADPDLIAADQRFLQGLGISTDGESLAQYFRQQKPAGERLEKIQALIRQLGDRSYEVREKASKELAATGYSAAPLLRQAVLSTDPEISRRAENCLQQLVRGPEQRPLIAVAAELGMLRQPSGVGILFAVAGCQHLTEKFSNPSVTSAAARLLAWRKPPAAAEVLLDYLPFAPDEALSDEVEAALAEVVFQGRVADPAVLRALTDPVPLRRAAAGLALCRAGGVQLVSRVRPLLHDPEPAVRFRLAMALAELREQDAVPVLIDLLAQLGPAQTAQVEELLREIAGEQAPQISLRTTGVPGEKCRDVWQAWWHAVDGQALLELFRRRTPRDADRDRMLALIRQLGDDDYFAREQASTQLVAVGDMALPLLRQALKNPDPEVMLRAQKCKEIIESRQRPLMRMGVAQVTALSGPPLAFPAALTYFPSLQMVDTGAPIPGAAARLLAFHKPPKATETLLAYLPFCEDELETEEIESALTALAFQDHRPNAVLVAALADKVPIRRAAAAVALCRAGAMPDVPAVRRLLKDSEPRVRLRVALTLAELKDKEVLPQLIASLTDSPEDLAWQAEDFLCRVAGESAPAEILGLDEASRRKARNAWAAWWHQNESRVDLTVLGSMPRLHGYTVVTEYTHHENGRVYELGRDGKPRWMVDDIPWPLEALVLPGKRLLLAEYYRQSVTERNFKGELLWQKQLNEHPLSIQRLANGNTFIATQSVLMEVDRSGKEVASVNRPGILMAQKVRAGRIALINSAGTFYLLDPSGKELINFHVGPVLRYGSFQMLANGGILVPLSGSNQVVEFDSRGKEVWKARVNRPTAVIRLPNGNTLASCRDFQLVVELDRSGKEVWQYKSSGYPWRAYRR